MKLTAEQMVKRTAERIAAIKSAWERGDSTRALAEKTGLSKGIVSGLYVRNRDALKDFPLIGTFPKKNASKPLPPVEPIETPLTKHLIDLEMMDCRYTRDGYFYCGCEAQKPYGYCADHYRRIYRKVRKDDKRATNA